MKASELQLGDWVSDRNGFPMRVTGYYRDVVYLDFDGNEGDEWEVKEEDVCPIPITHTILEKNNIHNVLCDPINEHFLFESSKNYVSIKVHFYPPKWKLEIYNDEYYPYFYRTFQGSCKYVHEFQRALRLCNIEKEIKL